MSWWELTHTQEIEHRYRRHSNDNSYVIYIYIIYIICMYVCMYVNNVNMYLYIFCSAKSNTEGDPSLPYPCPF